MPSNLRRPSAGNVCGEANKRLAPNLLFSPRCCIPIRNVRWWGLPIGLLEYFVPRCYASDRRGDWRWSSSAGGFAEFPPPSATRRVTH